MSDPRDALYRVIEMTDIGPEIKVVAAPDLGRTAQPPIPWNRKHRIYSRLQEAKAYKQRLAKEGRDARILRFAFEGEVD